MERPPNRLVKNVEREIENKRAENEAAFRKLAGNENMTITTESGETSSGWKIVGFNGDGLKFNKKATETATYQETVSLEKVKELNPELFT